MRRAGDEYGRPSDTGFRREGQSSSRGDRCWNRYAEGTTLAGVHRSGVVTHHPDTHKPVTGIQVPHWERMLVIAAKAVDMTGLDYLGVDLVIDRERGPFASRN